MKMFACMTLEVHGVCESRGKGNCAWSLSSLVGLFPAGLWVSNSDVTVLTVLSFRRVRLLVTPRTAAGQASLFISSSWSLLKPMPMESVMPPNHLILGRPLLLPPSIFPSIRVFSKQSVLRIRWPKYRSFSFGISPSNEHPGPISSRMDWLDLLEVQGTLRVFSNTTVRRHRFFSAQPFLLSNSHIRTQLLGKT